MWGYGLRSGFGPTFLFRMVITMTKVRATEDMDGQTFLLHINRRHTKEGEIAGVPELWENSKAAGKDRPVWEEYHERLHRERRYDHHHGDE